MSTGNPPAGYYADPSVPGYIRYWDGTEWVAGTSRPAPEEVADQVPASSQPGAAAESGGAHRGEQPQPQPQPQIPAQSQATEAWQPQPRIPAQPRFPEHVQAQPRPPAQPQHQETASVAPQVPESVATMVVPSAFGARNTIHHGFSYSDPFAGLPGLSSPVQAEEEREVETKVVELATPGSRILARVIDLGIAAVFSAPVTVSLLLVAHRHDHQYVLRLDAQATTTYTTLGMDGLGIGLWAGAAVTLLLVAIVLEAYLLGRGGQSFGKRLAGIRVVRLADGAPLTRRGVGTRRSILFWVLAILPLIDIVTLGGALWGRPYRQGAHERLTSTVTVKA